MSVLHAGDHIRDLTHPEWDLTVDAVSEQRGDGDHTWLACHDQNGEHRYVSAETTVDSVGLLRAAAEHVLRRGGRGARGEQEYYLRAALDHERHGGCPAMQSINRLCMFEQHALTELGGDPVRGGAR